MSSKKMIPAAVAAAAMAFGFGQAVHAKSPVPGKPGKQNIVELRTGRDKLTLFAPTDAEFEAPQRKLGVIHVIDGVLEP